MYTEQSEVKEISVFFESNNGSAEKDHWCTYLKKFGPSFICIYVYFHFVVISDNFVTR
jgi:hypothetical protein